MDYWLSKSEKYNLKPSSFDRKENTCKWQVYPYIGKISAKVLSIDDVESMIQQLRLDGYSYSSIKKAFEAVNACYRYYRQRHKLSNNPVDGIRVSSGGKNKIHRIQFYTYEQLQSIQAECQQTYKNGNRVYPQGDLIIILANTGMRVGELLALTWSDVDLCRRVITIDKNAIQIKDREPDATTRYSLVIQDSAKTSSSIRSVPINNTAYAAFLRLAKLNGKRGLISCSRTGKPINIANIRRTLNRVLKNIGFPPEYWYGVHALRHSFATNLLARGADVKKVSEILGHCSVTVTYDFYIHFIPKDLRSTVSLLDDVDDRN